MRQSSLWRMLHPPWQRRMSFVTEYCVEHEARHAVKVPPSVVYAAQPNLNVNRSAASVVLASAMASHRSLAVALGNACGGTVAAATAWWTKKNAERMSELRIMAIVDNDSLNVSNVSRHFLKGVFFSHSRAQGAAAEPRRGSRVIGRGYPYVRCTLDRNLSRQTLYT